MFFKIIIPNYNSEDVLEKCINSILSQTFTDYEIVFVDDLSTDSSLGMLKEYKKNHKNITLIQPDHKVWNGGARNVGIKYNNGSKYTLFMDDDDWFDDSECLQTIHDIIVENNYPDCVRLSYNLFYQGKNMYVSLDDDTPARLANSLYVAPWTHCIKTELVKLFPENTLVEDVSWHIEQCDVIETVVVCSKPIICWNRDNPNCTSFEENKTRYNGKRLSSVYRCIADLMDLQLNHDYCITNRDWRLGCYNDMIKNGELKPF